MPYPAPDPNTDYLKVPYRHDWEPDEDRAWALEFIRATDEGWEEDYQGFLQALDHRFPELNKRGRTFEPPSVDWYLRHNRMGQRMDIDWELAQMEMDEKTREAISDKQQEQLRARYLAAMRERGADPEDDEVALENVMPKTKPVVTQRNPNTPRVDPTRRERRPTQAERLEQLSGE